MSVIRAENLGKSVPDAGKDLTILDSISFTITPGETLAITGASGSGKSTLLNLIGGLDTPSAGEIEVAGERIDLMGPGELASWRSRHVGYIFDRVFQEVMA